MFDPRTIDDCYNESLKDEVVEGIKDSFGNWSTKGHPDRVVNIDQSVLKLFASLIDGTENWKEARMPTLHAKQILQL